MSIIDKSVFRNLGMDESHLEALYSMVFFPLICEFCEKYEYQVNTDEFDWNIAPLAVGEYYLFKKINCLPKNKVLNAHQYQNNLIVSYHAKEHRIGIDYYYVCFDKEHYSHTYAIIPNYNTTDVREVLEAIGHLIDNAEKHFMIRQLREKKLSSEDILTIHNL